MLYFLAHVQNIEHDAHLEAKQEFIRGRIHCDLHQGYEIDFLI